MSSELARHTSSIIAPTSPQSPSGQTTPDYSPRTSAWSTPGTSYFDSPIPRKSSIGSVTTIADSAHGSESSPILKQVAGSSPPTHGLRSKRAGFSRLDAIRSPTAAKAREEERWPRRVDSFESLTIGKHIADGQWSKVYNAGFEDAHLCCSCPAVAMRPASSCSSSLRPTTASSCSSDSIGAVFAAKVGSGRSSLKVLQNEARFLTCLMERPWARDYVVDFQGYAAERNMLVMENIPLTLEDFVTSMNAQGSEERSRNVMNDILPMARHLVHGLHFLHDNKVIHGDIKPANILIRHRTSHSHSWCRDSAHTGSWPPDAANSDAMDLDQHMLEVSHYEAVYCDFSAARFDDPDSIPTQSAGTYHFMAPELFKHKAPACYPTTSSDVYALGVTLLFAILGRSPYAFEQDLFRRRIMASMGTPLEFVAADCDSSSRTRLEDAGFQAFIERAVQARACDRWSAQEWRCWTDAQKMVH